MKSPDPGEQIYDPRERSWYTMGMSQDEPVISDTFQSATTGEWVVTAAAKLADGKGVFGANVSLNHLKESVDQIRIGNEGKLYMLDNGVNSCSTTILNPVHSRINLTSMRCIRRKVER